MYEQRRIRLARYGRRQVVIIPSEFEIPGDEVIVHRSADRLVIEPARRRGLVDLLRRMKPRQETFPEIDDPTPQP